MKFVSDLLSWFGNIDDRDIHREMGVVVATKLCIGFIVMPVESAEPSAEICLEIQTEMSSYDPATLNAIRNLREALLLVPPKENSKILQLALSAIKKAKEADFFTAVFLPSQALKRAGDFEHAVTRLNQLEQQQIKALEKALSQPCLQLLSKVSADSALTNFEAIETVASIALTLATSILIDGLPKE